VSRFETLKVECRQMCDAGLTSALSSCGTHSAMPILEMHRITQNGPGAKQIRVSSLLLPDTATFASLVTNRFGWVA